MLVRHISVEHAAMPNFIVKCGVDGCPDTYTKMNSFRKHLRTCHADEYSNSGDFNERDQELPRSNYIDLERDSSDETNDDDELFNPVIII